MAVRIVTSARTLAPNKTRHWYSNEGAAARVDFTLPSATPGLTYGFIVQDVDGIRVIAAAGDTIRTTTTVSAAAGRIDNAAVGSVLELVCINQTEWYAVNSMGTWTTT